MNIARRASSPLQGDECQQQAINHIDGPMLVVAGAGTGKTTVLTRRIARLIREGFARANQVVALTYTENAAQEMFERVQRELGRAQARGLEITTFHAYCNNLLIRSQRSFGVLDDKQLWVLLRRNLRRLKLNHFVRAANITVFLDDLLDFIRRCHDELVGPPDYADYVGRIERGELPLPRVSKSKHANGLTEAEALGRCQEIASVFSTVEQMLAERNLGTFGHMLVRAHELLRADPGVLEGRRARARFILVDEFQDANLAQIEILHQLSPGPGNIFAVGDPDQGIYRFRGASSDAFELFRKRFPAAQLLVLNRNRRSTTPILKCAEALISANPAFPVSGPGAEYRRATLISARDQQEPGIIPRRPAVEVVLVTGSFMESTDLVRTLMERRRRSRCDWKDMAVLYRSHFHRDEVAAELARNDVPFSIEGLNVMDTPEVRDLLACLRAVVSPADTAAWFRVAALRQFSLGAHDLRAALRSLNRKGGLAEVLAGLGGGAELLEAIAQGKADIAGKSARPALLSLSGRFRIPPDPAIQALLEFADAWERSPLTTTGCAGEFLEYLEDFREAGGTIPLPPREAENTVKLMTVHGAKGLEFDHVFVLRAVSNSFPASYREPLIEFPVQLRTSQHHIGNEDKVLHEQEERRLFYVAMTRARDTLTIYGPFGRGKIEKTPPGYLRELLKNRELEPWLKPRPSAEVQTEFFSVPPLPSLTRLAEWIQLPPASDLAATLSASAIERYELCPLQFKLEREWRIPSEVSAALQFGASIHRVLLAYYQSVRLERPFSEKEVLDLFRVDLATEGIADRYQHDLYEQQGIAQLREFLSTATQMPPAVIHTEETFRMKIGSADLVGRIDRMDRLAGDGIVITDYKTGRPKSQEEADESLQLSLYALAAREKWKYTAERLVFHNLEGNSKVTSIRTAAQLEEAKSRVLAVAERIKAGEFQAKPGFHCASCAYRLLCPKTEKPVPQVLASEAVESSP